MLTAIPTPRVPPMATIVLVHGAWHGSWCWERVVPLLEKRGLAVRTVDLPSVGAAPGSPANLSADAATVEAVLERLSGPVVLCGHSYGGMVISRTAPKGVTRLIYLCAFMPLEGQSLVTTGGGEGRAAPWIQMLDGGLMLPDMARAGEVFYDDCEPEAREWAKSRLRPQTTAIMLEPVSHPAWRSVPSTYIVCATDKAMPPDMQRNLFAPRAGEVVELQAGHSPFLSQPAAVAELLAARAGASGTTPN
jgi:pimeloyl-ACP methyl ester carboxylesterase